MESLDQGGVEKKKHLQGALNNIYEDAEAGPLLNAEYYLEKAGELELRDKLIFAATLHLIDRVKVLMQQLQGADSKDEAVILNEIHSEIGHNLKKFAYLVKATGNPNPLGLAAAKFVAVEGMFDDQFYDAKRIYRLIGDEEKLQASEAIIAEYEGESNSDKKKKYLQENYTTKKIEWLAAYNQMISEIDAVREKYPTLDDIKREISNLLENN
jgi:hypothetical protein